MASYGGELLLDSSSPWSDISSLSSFSIPLSFIFEEAKESIDEEDPRPSSSNGAYIRNPNVIVVVKKFVLKAIIQGQLDTYKLM